jgi:hypothetical protein
VPHEFEFNGGVWKPSQDHEAKFLCFMIVGGEEIPLHVLKRNGLVLSTDLTCSSVRAKTAHPIGLAYETEVSNVVKIFVQDSTNGFRRWYSFYFRIKGKSAPLVTINPFPVPQNVGGESGFYFRARGGFLTKNEAVQILDPESPSLGYLKRQRILPIPLLKQMISIDRTVQREGVRVVRLGTIRQGGAS